MFEWLAVGVLLLGLAAVTAGVICFDFDHRVAWTLIVAGGVVALVAGIVWTAVVKAAARRSEHAEA